MGSMNIKAESSCVSDVSVSSWEEGGLLVHVSLVDSNNTWLSVSHLVSSSVGDNPSLLGSSSDGLGSSIEVEPLSVVPWLVVLDSESVVVVSDVLMPEEGSSTAHS